MQPSLAAVIEYIFSVFILLNNLSTPVSEDQIQLVLRSGIKAPSARNSQTWKFTVIKDHALGNWDNQVDGISSASPRNDLKEFVTYK